ncbi:MAG: FkbM family methyltransferase [Pseudomonadota bacterium]
MTEILKTTHYQLVDARHGRFLANPADKYIGQSVIRYGEFSEIEWDLLNQIIKPGAIVVEAGANMGSFTVPIAKKAGLKGMVYAFEPQIAIFHQLCANLALNDLLNVQAFNAGCGDQPGWLPIKRLNPAQPNNYGGFSLEALKNENSELKVRIEALDDVLDVPRLNLIKADVEGMELQVLRGAAGLIADHRPYLYLEANEAEASADLYNYLKGLSYDMYWHLPRMFNPKNHRGDAEDLFPGIVSMNIMCIPSERDTKLNGFREVADENDHPKRWWAERDAQK